MWHIRSFKFSFFFDAIWVEKGVGEGVRIVKDTIFFFCDVNHEMDCRTAWLGVHSGTLGHCTKIHCSREGFVFQGNFFFKEANRSNTS